MAALPFELKFLADVANAIAGLGQVSQGVQETGQKVADLNSFLDKGQKLVGGFVGALAGYFAASKLESYIDKAREANKAQGLLNDTLKTSGQYSAEFRAELTRQQETLGALTKTGETQMATIQQQLLFFGAEKNNVEDLSRIVLRFAKLSGGDVPTALSQVTRALGTGTYQIRGYKVEVDKAASATEKQAQFIQQLKERLGELSAVTGGVKSYGAASLGLQVAIGRVLDIPVQAYYREFAVSVDRTRERVEQFTKANKTLEDILKAVGAAMGRVVGENFALVFWLAASVAAVVAFAGSLKAATAVITLMTGSLGLLGNAVLVVQAAFLGWTIGKFLQELKVGEVKVSEWMQRIELGGEGVLMEIGVFTESLMVKITGAMDRAFNWITTRVNGIVTWVSSTLGAIGAAASAVAHGQSPGAALENNRQQYEQEKAAQEAAATAAGALIDARQAARLAEIDAKRSKALEDLRLRAKWIEDDIKSRQQDEAHPKPEEAGAGGVPALKPPADAGGGGGKAGGGGGGGKGGGAAAHKKEVDLAAEAEKHYRQELDLTKEALALGEISQSQATAQNQKTIAAYIAQLQALQRTLSPTSDKFREITVKIKDAQAAMGKTTVFGNIKGQLIALKNQWGDVATQMGNFATQTAETISSTIGSAITDVIFRTGDWRQSMLQAAKSIIGSLIQIGVQMVLSHTLGEWLKSSGTATTVANNATVATSSAATAVPATGATSGANWVIGGIAAAAVIALLLGLMSGGFAEGGLIPGSPSRSDNRIARVATGEYVVNAPAVQFWGVDVLHAINSMAPSVRPPAFASGGLVGGGSSGGGSGWGTSSAGNGGSPVVNVGAPRVTLIQPDTRWAMHEAMRSAQGDAIILDAVARNADRMPFRR